MFSIKITKINLHANRIKLKHQIKLYIYIYIYIYSKYFRKMNSFIVKASKNNFC